MHVTYVYVYMSSGSFGKSVCGYISMKWNFGMSQRNIPQAYPEKGIRSCNFLSTGSHATNF